MNPENRWLPRTAMTAGVDIEQRNQLHCEVKYKYAVTFRGFPASEYINLSS
jgi:hypothetical protein